MPTLTPSLSNWRGFLVLLAAVAIALAILTQTKIGQQLQTALNSAVSQVPV